MITKTLIPDHFEKQELVLLLEDMTKKYNKQQARLKIARQRLTHMRNRIIRMKGIIEYQRERIVQLYGLSTTRNMTKKD